MPDMSLHNQYTKFLHRTFSCETRQCTIEIQCFCFHCRYSTFFLMILTGWVDLLEYLFQRVYKTSAERNPTDRFGDSLFHVVAKTACPFQYTQVIVIILKKYRIDPTRTDRHGQKPLDVAVRAHSEVYSLLRATILEWERSTSNWQEQRQQQQQQQYRPPPQQQQRGQPRFPYNPGNVSKFNLKRNC